MIGIKSLVLIFTSLIGFQLASAAPAVRINDMQGASKILYLGDHNVAPIALGGIVGHPIGTCAILDKDKTCDNCVLGTEMACNKKRVHPFLRLKVDFEVVGNVRGKLHLGYLDKNSKMVELEPGYDFYYTPPARSLKRGDKGTIAFEWGTLCQMTYNDPTCRGELEGGGDITFYLSVEEGKAVFPDSTKSSFMVSVVGTTSKDQDIINCEHGGPGICNFKAISRPGGVSFGDIVTSPNCPSTYKFARVFYSKTGFYEASYGNNFVDFPLGYNCATDGNWFINGLKEYVTYFFRMSVVDVAENNFFLTPNPYCTHSVPLLFVDDLNCDQMATPGDSDL